MKRWELEQKTLRFGASLLHVRLAAAWSEGGARANADSICSTGAWALRARAPIAFVPSSAARLTEDYVALACCKEAARAQ